MDRNIKIKLYILVAMLTCLGVGVVVGQIINSHSTQVKINRVAAESHPVRAEGENYKYINPLLGYDTAKATEFGEYQDLQDLLDKKSKQAVSDKEVARFSVYFRDLSRGRWVGVNEDEEYSPASLLKVPLMIAYYKEKETVPDYFSKKIVFKGGTNVGRAETIKGSQGLQVGETYTVEQLINYMIVYSDNDALDLLYSNIDPNVLNKLFSDFGILIPNANAGPQDFISPKTYALFFRVLYGSTYLNREDSESALALLSRVEYKNGLVAGVPAGTEVSHKFGEYGADVNGNVAEEFHDCGIVYYPDHPYLLCIMTNGSDLTTLQKVVKETSQLVYQKIDESYRK